MKKSLAEIFGSFFLYPAAIMLLAAIILGTGCGSTPDPVAPDPSTGEVTLFYSQPSGQPEEIPAVLDNINDPEVIAGSEKIPPSQTENSDEPDGESSDYLISPHDVLDISILHEEELSQIVRVSEKGAISFPLLGEIQVTGFTAIELERELEAKLEKDYLVSPSVNISIKEYSTISVLGQVKKPGSYEIKGRLTVTQAIAMAGGLTNIASPNGTTVIRKLDVGEKVIAVPLKDILGDGDLSRDIPLKPRDLIWVPESFF
jgi:protein involved in polysaccharide export with SLBB domain